MSLLLRNVRPLGGEATDVLFAEGRIAAIAPGLAAEGAEVEDGGGRLALPGLVDAHTHLDKTLLGEPWFRNEVGPTIADRIAAERREKRERGIDPHVQSLRHALRTLAHGTTRLRSHVDVDDENGLAAMEGVLATREALRGWLDIEIVAFPQSGIMVRRGVAELLDAALAMGADLVGGLDPCAIDRDPKGHLDVVFGLAERHGRPVDIHLHEPGEMGAFSLDLILERTRALGMQGRVAVSHAFALGAPVLPRREALIAALAEADVAILTTAPPAADVPSVRALRAAGVRVAAGNDGFRDVWGPFGDADMLERARLVAMKNDLRRDADLALALELCSTAGAAMTGAPDHGLAEGAPGDLVLVEAETLAEAVAQHPPRRLVVKGGRVVARDGAALRPAP